MQQDKVKKYLVAEWFAVFTKEKNCNKDKRYSWMDRKTEWPDHKAEFISHEDWKHYRAKPYKNTGSLLP